MTEVHSVQVHSSTDDGEPEVPYRYSAHLDEKRTQRVELWHSGDHWILSTSRFKTYVAYDGTEKLREVASNELLSIYMFAGKIKVKVHHDTYSKRGLQKWERLIVQNKKARQILSECFGITPEDLEWGTTFTPRHHNDKRYDWTEPTEVEFLSIEEQADQKAAFVQEIIDAKEYLSKKYPQFADRLDRDLNLRRNDLGSLLQFEGISVFTDSIDIPKWAWKGTRVCKQRRHSQLHKRYLAEGILTGKEDDYY